MYNDDDVQQAVQAGILDDQTAQAFKDFVAQQRQFPVVDEENFRLVSGFNDIFVVIAAALLLGSLGLLGGDAGGVLIAITSWGLAELFTRRRRMALPSIVLLFSFVGGVASGLAYLLDASFNIQNTQNALLLMLTALLTSAATALHWWRFRVPITVAVGMAAMALTVSSAVLALMGGRDALFLPTCFVLGLAVFALAMHWDMADPERRTNQSDVAFWLHLLAAPMMVHPVFAALGVGHTAIKADSAILIVGLYVVLAMVSLLIDRRALMVSALIYVMYAIHTLIGAVGSISLNFGLTAMMIGSMLLVLSAFWHPCRTQLVKRLPVSLQQRLPVLH